MAFCKNCGANIPDNSSFCSYCGTPVNDNSKQQTQQNYEKVQPDYQSASYTQQDIVTNKVMAVLAYIGILVLIPIFAAKDSKYARFHSSQGLTLFIIEVACGFVSAIASTILHILLLGFLAVTVTAILRLVQLCCVGLAIYGIVNAVSGLTKELPVTGKIKLIYRDEQF